ncbi:MAG: nucleotidyltransferase domain-containing protein [Candidatus Caldatribacteriaceae bacterium]
MQNARAFRLECFLQRVQKGFWTITEKTIYPEGLKAHRRPLYDKLSPFLKEVERLSRDYWGENLTAFVVFGSYARGEVSLDSDLDVLVVVRDFPQSFRARSLAFMEYLEKNLRTLPRLDVSPLVFIEDELRYFHPLFLDVRKCHIALYDRGFFQRDSEIHRRAL